MPWLIKVHALVMQLLAPFPTLPHPLQPGNRRKKEFGTKIIREKDALIVERTAGQAQRTLCGPLSGLRQLRDPQWGCEATLSQKMEKSNRSPLAQVDISRPPICRIEIRGRYGV